jgi:uncharacterized caspase-like protein
VQSGRRALLVATGAYEDPEYQPLRAPADEAVELAAVLGDPDIGRFDVRPALIDQSRDRICEEIETFFADAGSKDLLLLYLSCHAVLSRDGEPYFVARNTQSRLLHATGISKSFVTKVIDACRSRSILLVLDCCHSGAFGLTPKGGAGADLVPSFDGEGRVTLASSSRYQQSHEEPRGDQDSGSADSVFTRALVEGLRTGRADMDADGNVSLDEMYDYLYEEVRRVTSRQTPELSGRLRGDIWIARNPSALPPLPPEVTGGLEKGLQPKIRAAATHALGAILLGPDRALARSAEARLRELIEDDSRLVSEAALEELGKLPPPPGRTLLDSDPPPDGGERPSWPATIPASASLTGVAAAAEVPIVVSGDVAGQVHVWNLENGAGRAALQLSAGAVSAVVMRADGELIGMGGSDGSVQVWSGRDGESPQLLASHAGRVNAVALAPDGGAIASAGDDGDLCFGPVGAGQEAVRFPTHPGGVSALTWISERVVVTADLSGAVAAWDLEEPADPVRPIARWDVGNGIRAVAFGTDGTLAVGTDDGRLMVTRPGASLLPGRTGHAPATGEFASFAAHAGAVRAVVFAADGRLVSGGMDGMVRAWDNDWAAESSALTHPGGVRALAARSDGMVISAGVDGVIGLHSGFARPMATKRKGAP